MPDRQRGTLPQPTIAVFDVGRVIIQWDLRALFAKLIADPEELDWFLANVVTERWHFQHDAGRSLDEMISERQREFPAYADHLTAYRKRFLETIPGPIAGTSDLIERLDERGVPLYAITNFGAECWDMFRPTKPLLERFRDIVVSGCEKLAKPQPEIFALAADRFGHAPQDMLFIDDNADNIATAKTLGWHTHHFTDAAALEGDLVQRGLLEL